MRVDLLRLRLPPWPGGDATSVALRCGYRQPDGRWRDGGLLPMEAVVQRFRAKRVEICLHPGDVPMAAFPLPPLSGRRLRTAIPGAIEPCALQPLDELVTGFGPRTADGTVPAAWIARRVVRGWIGLLRQHGLAVRELHLPAAFLPCPAEGWVACRIDEWVVVRTGRDQGFAQWLPEGADRMAGLAAHADGDSPLPAMQAVQWAGDADAAECWSGEGWSWSLPVADAVEGRTAAAWVVPAVGWGALAIAVWLTGLNLYAGQLAREGQALKRQMAARVKAAFPDVPVVVNPVQQARQQKEALAAGGQPAATGDLAGLLRASSNLLAQAPSGQVQGLRYTAGALHVRWRDGGAPGAEERRALEAQGTEQGFGVKAGADGLRLTLAGPATPSDKNNDKKAIQ